MANFALVRGPWHGDWCWERVTLLPREAGHDVCTPMLTGPGKWLYLTSREIDLTTHIRDVVTIMENKDLQWPD